MIIIKNDECLQSEIVWAFWTVSEVGETVTVQLRQYWRLLATAGVHRQNVERHFYRGNNISGNQSEGGWGGDRNLH